MAGAEQRTEKPTGRQLRRARDKGNVARSADVGHAVSLTIFLAWSGLAGGAFLAGMTAVVRDGLAHAGARPSDDAVLDALLTAAGAGFRWVGPLVLLIALGGLLGQLLQVGWHLKRPLIEIRFSKLNPVVGLGNFFQLQKTLDALKALVKVVLFAGLAGLVVIPEWPRVIELAMASPGEILHSALGIAFRVLVRALAISALIAIADFALNKHLWLRRLYMTKQQIRDEHRECEGDPAVKAKIRSKQREALRRRMMAAVKTADVVVTNPTHVAVALRYDRKTMAAPLVLAKGRGYVAERIREEALAHGVPLLSDPPLARAIEKLCPVGHPIPPALYRAVAELLAYLFGQRKGYYRPHSPAAEQAWIAASGRRMPRPAESEEP